MEFLDFLRAGKSGCDSRQGHHIQTQPLIKRIKRPELEINHSPSSDTDVKNARNFTSTPSPSAWRGAYGQGHLYFALLTHEMKSNFVTM